MDDEEFQEHSGPSKSQRKREASALQDMGTELVKLSREQLEKITLPDALLAEILEARRIRSHGALRRQMQYIGKLMREADAAAIAAQLAEVRGESNASKAAFHALEQWRERLMADDQAVTAWLASHPATDAQQLRQLIRNARKEAAENKPPKSSRALFRLLRETA
jgi:ribosome-associated protein